MPYISPQQTRAKAYSAKKGYKLRKIKEGRIKVRRPDDTEVIVQNWDSAWDLMIQECYGSSNKNIFS